MRIGTSLASSRGARNPWLAALVLWHFTGAPALAQGAPATGLAAATDLAADARAAASRGVPLVLLYSREDCSWCARVRREHLAPLARDPSAAALVRELYVDRRTPIVDFAGRHTNSEEFASQMQARFAPTVMFHGPDGTLLAESIVGYRLADFYGAYLESAIEESRKLLQRRK